MQIHMNAHILYCSKIFLIQFTFKVSEKKGIVIVIIMV